MKTAFIAENKTFFVYPVGRITTSEAGFFESALTQMPSDTQKIVVDMEQVDYISSSCLRILLTLRQRFSTNECVAVIHCNNSVYEIIHTTGFDSMLTISLKKEDFKLTDVSFKDILQYRIQNNPDDVFITYRAQNYTWMDIEVYSQIIAHDLRQKGVKELTHVGIIGTNSFNFVLTFFALQKLGAIAVLFNDKLTLEEIHAQREIGDVTIMCIGNLQADKKNAILDELSYDIADDVDFSARASEYSNIRMLYSHKVLADNPALMIFSSGSTGKPKAVLLSGENLICDSISQIKRWNIQETDSLCLAIPLFHIFSFKTGFVYSVINNNRIAICEDAHTQTIIDTIEKENCTLFHAVPTLMLAVVKSPSFNTQKLNSLRISVIAGAMLPKPQMQDVMKALPNLHIMNLYGLSEINPLSATAYGDNKELICDSVGRIASNVTAKVVSPQDSHECEPYESGEILAKGEHSFLCYYKLPAESQAMDAEGFVHTGDLGYFDDAGYLHLTGRIKEIIIRGGENILPGEIVNAITEFDNIKEAFVLGMPDEFYGEIVTACLSLNDPSLWNVEKLNAFLATKIAPFKIPCRYLIMDELPKLGNGKMDRKTMEQKMENAIGKK